MPRISPRGPDTRYHPAERCTYCGAHQDRVGMRVAIEHRSYAAALMCLELVDCLRRQRERRIRRDAA